jgi:hypothetical protein
MTAWHVCMQANLTGRVAKSKSIHVIEFAFGEKQARNAINWGYSEV